jgi:sugar lactone lactonase YvrE
MGEQAVSAVHAITEARIFHDGTVTEPRLLHPESVAVASDGAIWCGGELGHLYRLSEDGSELREVACTGGFILGIAFDTQGRLYACDLKHGCVFRYDPAADDLTRFASGDGQRAISIPNWPVVDAARNVLYVSDSHKPTESGPGIWRFDLDSGEGTLWFDHDLTFANGMALAPDGQSLLVAETFGRRITRIPIEADRRAGNAETVVETPGVLPDGLAFDGEGNLYIACYEPSRILRLRDGVLELFLDDPEAHTLCHPTNCAFRGSELLIANLGRWHITSLRTDATGLPLPIGG